MRILILAALAGCIDGKPDPDDSGKDTGDTGAPSGISFDARIQIGCANTDCTVVDLYGDASGDDVVDYAWTVRGAAAGTSSTTTATVKEPGELVEVTLTVTDADGSTDTASLAVAHLDYTLTDEGIDSGFDPGFATIAMPGDIPCGGPIGIANIGGCIRQNDFLYFTAKDLGTNTFRGDPVIYDADAGGLYFVSNDSFIDTAAWFQGPLHGGAVQFHKMTDSDYSLLGGIYQPIARDPVVIGALGLQAMPEDHFTMWLTATQSGTEVFASHVNIQNGQPIFHERKITATCADGTWAFGLDPITEDDQLEFPVVVKPKG